MRSFLFSFGNSIQLFKAPLTPAVMGFKTSTVLKTLIGFPPAAIISTPFFLLDCSQDPNRKEIEIILIKQRLPQEKKATKRGILFKQKYPWNSTIRLISIPIALHKILSFTKPNAAPQKTRKIHTCRISFSSLPFPPAAAHSSLQKVTNHGINIVAKYAVSLDGLQVTETHRQHHLHAAAQHRVPHSSFLLTVTTGFPCYSPPPQMMSNHQRLTPEKNMD